MTTVSVSDRAAHDLKADALVLGTVAGDRSAALAAGHGLPSEAERHLSAQLAALHASGKAEEVLTVEFDPAKAATTREQFPALKDRRLGLAPRRLG